MYEIKTPWQRFVAHFQAWFVDHEILRIFYRNFFKIGDNAFRSNHPSPRFIRKLKEKHGIKTIINLRGANKTGQYMLEKEACEAHGVTLIDVPFSSRNAPRPESIHKLFNIFDTAEYPILLHCKSGADRAGIGSVFYRFYKEGIPLDQTGQLSLKYGHIRQSETGVLDYFIEHWVEFHQQNPDVPFITWIDTIYDFEAVNKSYNASKWGNLLVNKILRRE